jgi:hypothetical protein
MANPYIYRSIVGALQYITVIRLDISYAVNKASQFIHSCIDEHWNGVKTISYGLHICASSSFELHAYFDADWAEYPDDRRSTSGFFNLFRLQFIVMGF